MRSVLLAVSLSMTFGNEFMKSRMCVFSFEHSFPSFECPFEHFPNFCNGFFSFPFVKCMRHIPHGLHLAVPFLLPSSTFFHIIHSVSLPPSFLHCASSNHFQPLPASHFLLAIPSSHPISFTAIFFAPIHWVAVPADG